MRSILSTVTKNRSIGLMIGAFVTMVIQSSSATTVMLVSFVQAGLMSFTQSLAVILGADIGTTVTAQLVAFKLTDYALLLIAIGFSMTMFSKNESLKHIGESILGFGILFFGMKIMSDAMHPLRSYSAFLDVLKELENPLLGILIGAVVLGIGVLFALPLTDGISALSWSAAPPVILAPIVLIALGLLLFIKKLR